MKRSLVSRLDKHFAGASALAAAAGVAGTGQTVEAGVVYSGPVNITIPTTTAGVYLNVVTGVNAVTPAGAPGWDVNPWGSGGLYMFNPAAPTGGVYVVSGGVPTNLAPGTPIDGTSTYGSGLVDGTFVLNSSDNIVGFRFQNEAAGNQTMYGWMRISLSGTTSSQPRAVVEYAYEDTGLPIAAGATTGGGPSGACCIPATLTCAVTSPAQCTTLGGTYNGDGSTCATANCPSPGACCKPDGTCAQTTSAACTTANGVYHGDSSQCASANCPPAGACCLALGACSSLTSGACTSAGGTYRGDGTTCANAACPGGLTMVCNIPGTFTDISSTGTQIVLDYPTGTTGDDATGAFTSSITNAAVPSSSLYACSNGHISNLQTFTSYTNAALPATAAGLNFALFPNWDDLYADAPGMILHQATTENGIPVEIIEWYQIRTFAGGTAGARGNFEVKIFGAGGPALVQYLYDDMSWDGNGANSTVGVQWGPALAYTASVDTAGSIANGQVCSVLLIGAPAACYANCDNSTNQPCLNVLDFSCFLNKFAAQDTYANCDNSTNPPVLNVLDFSCFLNKFAAGCSSC